MATAQDFGGLLFGMGGSGLEEYLTPAQTQGIQNQAMLQAASALLQAGGPSARPVSLGQALGGALQAGQQGYSQAQQGAVQTLMAGQKLREAKSLADIRSKMAADEANAIPPEGGTPEDAKFNTYMKYSQLYAQAGNFDEAKKLQDMAYQIKPRAEVTGSPFEVSGVDGKPLLVQQMKDGTIRTVEGYGPKREIVLQDLGGRTVAVDKSKLTGGESFGKTLAPQVVGGAETGYYAIGGGGGGGGQRPAAPAAPTPPLGTTIMRPDYTPPAPAPAGQVLPPAGVAPTGLTPIIAGTGPKPSETFYKSALGIQNTNDAVNNFTSALEGFKTQDMFSPEKRAVLGSAHSNAMLQAKELYNLGVLTGGDEAILNKVLSNPVDFTSAATPIESIRRQAEDLQKVIQGANKNLARVYKQQEIPLNKPPVKPATTAQNAKDQIPVGTVSTSASGKPMIKTATGWDYIPQGGSK